jgi:hypothetical protein
MDSAPYFPGLTDRDAPGQVSWERVSHSDREYSGTWLHNHDPFDARPATLEPLDTRRRQLALMFHMLDTVSGVGTPTARAEDLARPQSHPPQQEQLHRSGPSGTVHH